MNNFDTYVAMAETKLKAMIATGEAEAIAIYDKIEPVVEPELVSFAESVGEIALGAVLKQVPLIAAGTEKFGAAVTDVVQTVEANPTLPAIAMSDAQQAVQNSVDALGVAKSNILAEAAAALAAAA